MVCTKPPSPLATSCTVDVPAGVCGDEDEDEDGEPPHAVSEPDTPHSSSKRNSVWSFEPILRLYPATDARSRPGIQSSARPVGRGFPNRNSNGTFEAAAVFVWMVTVVLAVVLVPVNETEAGWKLQEESWGRPVQEKTTIPT